MALVIYQDRKSGKSDRPTNSIVRISSTAIVTGNKSAIGMFISLTKKSKNVRLEIENVSVIGTSGGIFGISVFDLRPDAGLATTSASVHLHGVTVENIRVDTSNPAFTALNPAAIAVMSFRNMTISDCIIRSNQVTGIVLFASTVVLQGNISLINNSGVSGGGIALLSNSIVVFNSSTKMVFLNNTAKKFGGGIYVSQDLIGFGYDNRAVAYCFAVLTSDSPQPVIEFNGNEAVASGANMYGGYEEKCVPSLFNEEETRKVSFIFRYFLPQCNQTQVSSDPFKIVTCDNQCPNTSGIRNTNNYVKVPPIFPGQDFNFTIAAVGEYNGLTPAIVKYSSNQVILNSQENDQNSKFKALKPNVLMSNKRWH